MSINPASLSPRPPADAVIQVVDRDTGIVGSVEVKAAP
jgi:hypothetical protein